MGWWPFNRRPKAAPGVETPPVGHGDTSETWAVGDLAECIAGDESPWWFPDGEIGNGPSKGDLNRVTGVHLYQFGAAPIVIGGMEVGRFRHLRIALTFSRYDSVFQAAAFRKVTPRADTAEAADAGFIDLLTKVRS